MRSNIVLVLGAATAIMLLLGSLGGSWEKVASAPPEATPMGTAPLPGEPTPPSGTAPSGTAPSAPGPLPQVVATVPAAIPTKDLKGSEGGTAPIPPSREATPEPQSTAQKPPLQEVTVQPQGIAPKPPPQVATSEPQGIAPTPPSGLAPSANLEGNVAGFPDGSVEVRLREDTPPGIALGLLPVATSLPQEVALRNTGLSPTNLAFQVSFSARDGGQEVPSSIPITVMVVYQESQVAGLEKSQIALYKYDEVAAIWQRLSPCSGEITEVNLIRCSSMAPGTFLLAGIREQKEEGIPGMGILVVLLLGGGIAAVIVGFARRRPQV